MADEGESADAPPHPRAVARRTVLRRRLLVAGLVALTVAAFVTLAVATLAPGGIGLLELSLILLFAATLPWPVLGFWNAVIGFWLMRACADPVAVVLPAVRRLRADAPIKSRIAVLMCVRNERPERVVSNLRPLLDGLAAAGICERVHAYVLSDTDDPVIAAEEEALAGALAARFGGRLAVTYRRRTENTGYKAGNIAEFCARLGEAHDLAVVLDADSLMPASAVLRMVRLMEAAPEIGILQALVIGRPATSAFTRLFQLSMRLGMRSYTLGSAWWQADCGPYWGHNAVLRLKPFIACCALPALPGGEPVLSHDQIEAVLMRRAGYEVRVLPEETLGFEENPPTLVEFLRRDLRWCRGNMQYRHLLALPGLVPTSRVQLALAMLMFLGSPVWIALLSAGTAALALAGDLAAEIDAAAGVLLVAMLFFTTVAPQVASAADVLLHAKTSAAYGGRKKFAAGIVVALLFVQTLAPIMAIAHTLLLARLPFGGAAGWASQTRDDHRLGLAAAARLVWPQTAFGLVVLATIAFADPAALPVALLYMGGAALAVPFAVATASPALGAWMRRTGLAALPEDIVPPPVLLPRDDERPLPAPAGGSVAPLSDNRAVVLPSPACDRM
ncbi:Glucans biosynthesis glucosyltransferase H [Rhodovulum sp. PH10]|uniref:glucans biosynthesis glucosyltransferase MdoH n=1 Tax=Rhodovulum sp. PH10 TaxID=1187851 RepID=UPI00027C272C|nr:glucans biosynthesis glucosyltransferase MdoH [Rhodovulum sp. PH10]EJW13445.1 Glucans biosynthesis glucosyltransferase H [Rhodovulum sp. PH10]